MASLNSFRISIQAMNSCCGRLLTRQRNTLSCVSAILGYRSNVLSKGSSRSKYDWASRQGVELHTSGNAHIRFVCETACCDAQPARALAVASSPAPTLGTLVRVVLQSSARNIASVSGRRCDVLNLRSRNTQNRSPPETKYLL